MLLIILKKSWEKISSDSLIDMVIKLSPNLMKVNCCYYKKTDFIVVIQNVQLFSENK